MDPALKEVASSVLTTLLGAIGTGIGWLIKSAFTAKKDLNYAHEKLRNVEQRLSCVERTIYYEGD